MYFITASGRLRESEKVLRSCVETGRRLRHPYAEKIAGKGSKQETSHAGTDIHAVLDQFVAAHAAHDAEALFALYSDDLVAYSLAPPLQQGPDTPYGTVPGIQA